ncbi:hypothetical protein KP005_11270 [Geomonas nitrogeniifigens]|uniref:Oligosaccharide repeat unit polymerase n=1 Tax=Geomonas diazotrophica TaxID=2843197 RepID=A0ABX8JC03_9BACT|nr:hypothetical protein [Geomonas nitrogeniifigens]QWV95965.1 hypothetical protein KP005_11270 [Geomonas nitrogeniifigens]
MINVVSIVIIFLPIIYFIFLFRPTFDKTLSAWRWMLAAWSLLTLFCVFNPVQYHLFQLTLPTIMYCVLWLFAFVAGDLCGALYGKLSRSRTVAAAAPLSKRFRNVLDVLIVASLICGIYYGYEKINSVSGSSLDFVLSDLRGALTTQAESKFTTIAVDVALTGLVFSLIRISDSLLANSAPSLLSFAGLFAYLSVYIFRAGRQGIGIAGIALIVVVGASIQSLNVKFRHFKRLAVLLAAGTVLLVGYFTYNTMTRSTGGEIGLDRKILFFERALACSVDRNFVESMQKLDPLGSSIIEIFVYYSPQFYGLDFALNHPYHKFAWGGLQFNYFARAVERLLNLDIFVPIVSAWEDVFVDYGVYPNFFRTAVATTYMDFGYVFNLGFLFSCGFLAGRVRYSAVTTKSPFYIALQGLLCSGAVMTTIYSPFCEIGWAYPWLVFMLLYFVVFRKTRRYERRPSTSRLTMAECGRKAPGEELA